MPFMMPFQWSTFWSALSAIFTGAAVFAIFIARKQLRFNAWLRAQEIFTARDFTEARRRIFARLDNQNQNWTEEEETEALQVCRKMDEFAGLVPYLPKRAVLRIWGVPFAMAWLVLEPVVERERTKCNWSDKWNAFAQLGRLALDSHPKVRNIRIPVSDTTATNNPSEVVVPKERLRDERQSV
jgi:hypothetical protein